MSIKSQIDKLRSELHDGVELVAVSKTHPVEAIEEAYACGQRVFAESRPQELKAKHEALPKDIEWRMIGHLQTNKIKMILPFVSLIESLDSLRLAQVIEKESAKLNITVDCLLEIHVADELSKTGWAWEELINDVKNGAFDNLPHIRLRGVMGIASYSNDMEVVKSDFKRLKAYKEELSQYFTGNFDTISMGMSGDYKLAMECGSTSIRVGSMIFGARDYSI
ncbi:MAG: YggS family pyridoxal phosphate-dependent enzyme [Rikenellaceae bacterium]